MGIGFRVFLNILDLYYTFYIYTKDFRRLGIPSLNISNSIKERYNPVTL